MDLSAYLDPQDDAAVDDTGAQDLEALKACLKALADAVANTNLAVLSNARGDDEAASARVQASVAALRRFGEAFCILDDDMGSKEPAED